jgi:hypothetical protein
MGRPCPLAPVLIRRTPGFAHNYTQIAHKCPNPAQLPHYFAHRIPSIFGIFDLRFLTELAFPPKKNQNFIIKT